MASHDVYVVDSGNFRVQKFDSAGNFILMFGKGVDRRTGGDVCTAASGDVCQAGMQGSGGGAQFSSPGFVAVDDSTSPSRGDVYVADTGTNVVSKFDASGGFISSNDGKSATNGPFGSLAGLAVDTSGNVWVYGASSEMFEFDQGGGFLQNWESGFGVSPAGIAVDSHDDTFIVRGNPLVEKLTSSGGDIGPVTAEADNHASGLAVDPTSNDLYVEQEGSTIEQFASCGPSGGPCSATDSFGAEHLSGAAGLSVDSSTGKVYVADKEDQRVVVFAAVPIAARIDKQSALAPTESTVTLQAAINPLGADTTYQFQYGPTSSYGASAPVPGADLGAGSTDQLASAALTGLQPSTTYHFRAVATNALGTNYGPDQTFATDPENCPNGAFRTGPSAKLQDCRAYEMLTPNDKEGSEDMFASVTGAGRSENEHTTTDVGYGADSGNRFLINSDAAFGPNPIAGHSVYVFSRTTTGWTTTSVAPAGAQVKSLEASVFNPELTTVGVNVKIGSHLSAFQVATMFGPPGGPYTTVIPPPGNETTEVAGSSADFGHLVLQTQDHSLVPAAAGQVAGSKALYDWENGRPQLVNVRTDGSLTSACGAVLGFALEGGAARNAVSRDGSKIFFTSPDPETGSSDPSCYRRTEPLVNPPRLYMRLNGATTVDVSAPNPGVSDPNGFQPVAYVGAAADGSRVFFMTQTELTADDTTHDPELYEYNTVDRKLTRISRGTSGSADGNVRFVGAVSNDGSTVYFTAYGRLTPNAPALSREGEQERVNAYRYDTNTGTTSFIATVSTRDFFNQRAVLYALGWETGLDTRSNWYSTPDGRFLVFASVANLTRYDSKGKSEVYRYDSLDGRVLCVSCLPSGAPPSGNAQFARAALYADNSAGRPPRAISDDGSYVFFDTADALVPQDTNGKIDVYEWHDGALSLVTPGKDPSDSFFLDSSASGHDVFFGTHAQLVAQDTNVAGDLYDARVGGGFSSPSPSQPCSEEGCHGPLSASALPPTAASEQFSGEGNLTPDTTKHVAHKKKAKKSKSKRRRKPRRHNGVTSQSGRSTYKGVRR